MTASHQTGKMTTRHIGIRTAVHNPVPGSVLVLVCPHALVLCLRWCPLGGRPDPDSAPVSRTILGSQQKKAGHGSWPECGGVSRLRPSPLLSSTRCPEYRSRPAVSTRCSAGDSALAGELEMVAVVNQVMVNCDQCDQRLVKQGRSQCLVSDD